MCQRVVSCMFNLSFSYLFDGIGHLIAAIFIASTQYIQRININGVKKMSVLKFSDESVY